MFEMDEFEEYYKNSEWFGTYQSDLMMGEAFKAGQQSMQAKMEGLQTRVDQQGLIIAKAMSIASDLQKSWSMFEIGKKLEQAIKGEGQ